MDWYSFVSQWLPLLNTVIAVVLAGLHVQNRVAIAAAKDVPAIIQATADAVHAKNVQAAPQIAAQTVAALQDAGIVGVAPAAAVTGATPTTTFATLSSVGAGGPGGISTVKTVTGT